MLMWTYRCDGSKCTAEASTIPAAGAPPGWLVRTVIDRVDSLEESATGTGLPGGRSELQRIQHYCGTCRRKGALA